MDYLVNPLGVTLLFASFASYFHYKKFLKQGIAVSVVVFSLLVFFIVKFVSFEDNIGLGIGLLGILSLIRLRTALGSLIDISFIFYAITIGLLNASLVDAPFALIMTNLFLTTVVCVMASGLIFRKEIASTKVTLDDVDLAGLDNINYLKLKIADKIGIRPIFVKVDNIDFLKDTVTLKVTYELNSSQSSSDQ